MSDRGKREWERVRDDRVKKGEVKFPNVLVDDTAAVVVGEVALVLSRSACRELDRSSSVEMEEEVEKEVQELSEVLLQVVVVQIAVRRRKRQNQTRSLVRFCNHSTYRLFEIPDNRSILTLSLLSLFIPMSKLHPNIVLLVPTRHPHSLRRILIERNNLRDSLRMSRLFFSRYSGVL